MTSARICVRLTVGNPVESVATYLSCTLTVELATAVFLNAPSTLVLKNVN
jgi:hypothetical protein